MLGKPINKWGAKPKPSVTHPQQYLLTPDRGGNGEAETKGEEGGRTAEVTEDDVMMAPSLETFASTLPEEDAERLVSFLTAPYVATPPPPCGVA